MRQIRVDEAGRNLADMLNEKDPLQEDIGIVSPTGDILGVVISARAYEFFLRKVQEEEDRIDDESVTEFHKTRG